MHKDLGHKLTFFKLYCVLYMFIKKTLRPFNKNLKQTYFI